MQTEGRSPSGERVARPEWLGLVALLDELTALDPRGYVQAASDVVEAAIVQPLCARVAPLATLLQLLEAATEVGEPHVATLCFVARTEVRAAARALQARPGAIAERLVAADILRTRMLNAIEAVLASAEGRPADWREREDGRVAARVRALYGRLRDTLAAANKRREATPALASIAVALHSMTLQPEWAEVRLSDRFVLESLYRRILAWGHPDAPSEEGDRLVLDAVAMTALLDAINRRPSLRGHDLGRLEAALRAIADEEPDGVLVEALSLLRGRDPQVDAFLGRLHAAPGNPPLRRILAARLEVVRAELLPPAPGENPAERAS